MQKETWENKRDWLLSGDEWSKVGRIEVMGGVAFSTVLTYRIMLFFTCSKKELKLANMGKQKPPKVSKQK